MRNVQKLEPVFGLATFAATLIVAFVYLWPLIELDLNSNVSWLPILIRIVAMAADSIVPASLIGFATIRHARAQNEASFIVILVAGSILICMFTLIALGISFYGVSLHTVYVAIPAFLAARQYFWPWLWLGVGSASDETITAPLRETQYTITCEFAPKMLI